MRRALGPWRLLTGLALVAALAVGARADVVVLKDGRRVEGTLLSEGPDKVRLRTALGEVEFARDQIASIERSRTTGEELRERERTARTSADFHQLALWAEERRLKADARRLMLRALELEPGHAGANTWLGRVLHKGEWMTPQERDQRLAAEYAAEMLARGLLLHEGRWVTPEEREHLERGEVLHEGRWMPFDEAQRLKGLELFDGVWLPRAEALARGGARAVEQLLGTTFNQHMSADCLLLGPQPSDELARIAEGLTRGRAWFSGAFRSAPGLELFGGRLAEFHMFFEDAEYQGTTAHFGSLTTTVPAGWAEAVRKTHGFFWCDPFPLSSVRLWLRHEDDVAGHDYHHWGHLLVSRLGYDGRLLPPWFEEGVAALLEHRTHGRNLVFCRGSRGGAAPGEGLGPETGGGLPRPPPGTKAPGRTAGRGKAARAIAPFDPKAMRAGEWRAALAAGLDEYPCFDKLAALQFTELEGPDIAASMGIVAWLESLGALRPFLDVLRQDAPPSPLRVHRSSLEFEVCYERAFRAAAGLGWKQADQAWRAWIRSP